ncbi:MAG: alpha/beta hydrolase [Ignavibacteriales bacterium]|nr:alpha/beta hydrolase [Ignavibacteriales bacterium]
MKELTKSLTVSLLSIVTLIAGPQSPQESTEKRISVAPGVSIHVVGWGGKGEALLFLSGLASTAYVFDEFAPMFTDSYRTVGLTRRGIPPSDSSQSGYAIATLTQDIVTVMDSLHIASAHVVGWSFGGNEAVWLATTRSNRVRSVILLDSYDNSPQAATFAGSNTLKSPQSLPLTSFDSTSIFTLMWRMKRMGVRPFPIRAIRASRIFSHDGHYLGTNIQTARLGAMIKGSHRLSYSSVTVPLLAFFNVANGVGDYYASYATMSDSNRALVDMMYFTDTREAAAARARLQKEVPTATFVEIAGAEHAIFNSNPERVFLEMRRCLTRIRNKSPR